MAVVALLGLSACASFTLVNAAVPTEGYRTERGIAYGSDSRQRLDLYLPDGPGPKPVVVFFYGGSWQTGERGDYRFVGQALASRGILAVIPDYRLYPQVRYPVFLEDSAAAVAWVRAHVAEHGGDPARLFLAGHSAGAYNAAMVALDPSLLGKVDGDRSWIAGVIGVSGPYDFIPLTDPKLVEIFGGDRVASTQPVHYVSPGAPPMLLVHGTGDTTVLQRNTDHLAARLRDTGNEVSVKLYPGMGHIRTAVAFAHGFRWLAPTLDDLDAFVKQTGKR